MFLRHFVHCAKRTSTDAIHEHAAEKVYMTADAFGHHAQANHNMLSHCKHQSMATRQNPLAFAILSCHCCTCALEMKQDSHYSKQEAEHDGRAVHALACKLAQQVLEASRQA